MRSMYRFSMIAMAVGALALLSAGSALAAQHEGMKGLKISGSMTADLEYETTKPATGDSTSQIGIQSEAVLDFAAGSGPVSMKFRIEANDNKTTLDNVRNAITWKVTDAFSMTISGMSFGETAGIAPFGASTVGHFTQNGSNAGHRASNTAWIFGVNRASADFRFGFGGSNAGVVLNPAFLEGRAVTSDVGTTAAVEGFAPTGCSTGESMTLVPYYNGAFGNLSVHAYYATSSGKVKDTSATSTCTAGTEDPSASEASIAAVFKAGQMSAVLQMAPGSFKAAGSGTEYDFNTINLGLRFGAIKFHYITETEEPSAGGTATEDNVDMALSYTSAISEKAEWTVGYANNKEEGGNTISVLAFGLGLGF